MLLNSHPPNPEAAPRAGATGAARLIGLVLLLMAAAVAAAAEDGPARRGLVLWLDAGDVDGDEDAANDPSPGEAVAHWADKSGCGNHALQPVPASRPVLVVGQSEDGRRAVRFIASREQFLHIPRSKRLDLNRLTACVVATASTRPHSMWLFSKNRFDGEWTGYGIAVEGASAVPWPHLGIGGRGPDENGYVKAGMGIDEGLALVELRCDGRRMVSGVNGRGMTRSLSGAVKANDVPLLIGAGAQASPAAEFLNGEIAELLLYDQALEPAEQERTRRYLARKHGLRLTHEDDPGRMVVRANGYLPLIVENPITPNTETRDAADADAVLRRDWLFQADSDPTVDRARQEIGWARELADRIVAEANAPDLSAHLSALLDLDRRLAVERVGGDDPDMARTLYLEVRRVKRRIAFSNPAIDFSRILLIDQPYPQGPEAQHEAVHRLGHRAVPGGRLLVLDGLHPGGRVRRLFPPEPGSFWRPELSFDGARVLFCFKPHDSKSFHLYEIGLDGGRLRQLTNSDYDDIDPIYLPDGRILFTTTRGNTYVRCGPYIYSYALARCDADGGNVYLISTNSEPDFVPALLNDGRVVYSRWEYSDKDQNRVQSLWTTNPDGTGTVALWGNQSIWPDHLAEPRPVPGSDRVMFAGVGHHNWFIGSVGVVDPREGSNYPSGLTRVTRDLPWGEVGNPPDDRPESPRYHASGRFTGYLGAYPISERDFLVSARGAGGKFRIYLMDVDGNRELVYEGVYNAWYAIPVRPRPVPPQRPDFVAWPGTGKERRETEPGLFYSTDVYEGVPDLPRGSVKFLRVFQQDAKTCSTWKKTFVFSGPAISAVQTEAVKRIVSTVPVETDGSVYFEAPAGESLFFQLLDEEYRALHTMRSFTGIMPGERRGCVGCHELRSGAPPVKNALAMRRPPTPISPPPWGDESIGYLRFVQPVLDRHCGTCHQGAGKARETFDLTLRPATGDFAKHVFKEPYLTLIGPAAWPVAVPSTGQAGYGLAGAFPVYGLQPTDAYPNDPATDARSTIWRTMRPMRYLSFRSRLVEMARGGEHHGVRVEGADLLRLIAWVDANCPYLGEQELRAMDDPEFPGIEQLPVRPRVKTAPVVPRP